MAYSLQITIVLVVLTLGCHAAKIKYILRSGGSLDSDPDFFENKWPREIHSIASSSSNSIHTTTEAPVQNCELNGSCGELPVDGYGNLEATFKPFPQEHLNKILQKFTNGDSSKLANVYVDRNDNIDEIEHVDNPQEKNQHAEQQSPQAADKSKSWNLVNQQNSQHYNNNNNKHPYDDRQGWVTLEPIAWSSSQIQKWEPNPRPTFPSPNEAANYNWNGPSSSKPPYGGSDRPWNKPSYEYNTKPQWGNKPAQWSSNQNYEYKPTYSSGGSWGGNSDIITDNRPGSFPPDNRPAASHDSAGGYRPWGGSSPPPYNKQPSYNYGNSGSNNYASSSSERPSYASTADGDGHWVLLSSTKGYSIPQRHRSNSRSMNLAELERSELPKTIVANVVNSS